MLIVQKYGGTSVKDIDRIRAVAERVKHAREAGNGVAVVVSAMAGTTDYLLGLAKEASGQPDEREMDAMVATGEQVSAALLAITLKSMGIPSTSFTGWQAGIETTEHHTQARIEKIDASRLRRAIEAGEVPVLAGFQGVNPEGDVATLGRGGSDLTAVALAHGLSADICEIYTDVDGVYTTDPNIVPGARKLEKISYDEMLEMASLGAKVLQTRSVEFAKKYNVAVVVRSSYNENPGTYVIKEDEDMEQVVVSGITYDRNQAKISVLGVPDKPGIASRVFGSVAEANLNVDMIVQNVSHDGRASDISFTLPRGEAGKGIDLLKRAAGELGAENVTHDDHISKISVIGVGMRTHSGVASKMFEALAAHNINIMMISTSEIKISCVIEEKFTELAVRVLHDAFELEK